MCEQLTDALAARTSLSPKGPHSPQQREKLKRKLKQCKFTFVCSILSLFTLCCLYFVCNITHDTLVIPLLIQFPLSLWQWIYFCNFFYAIALFFVCMVMIDEKVCVRVSPSNQEERLKVPNQKVRLHYG